jgi:ubiquinone/menaquinone biosynthesis C-methylase UbiE
MFAHTTDRDWQLLGETDPYWAVLTDERFRSDQLNDDRLEDFYSSGQQYVDLLLDIIRRQIDPKFAPRSALDFGCGVGRIAIPLARFCEQVVGVDVSEGMLAKARERAANNGLHQVAFVVSDDRLSRVHGLFDLVHTYIVLQHIPPVRGQDILRQLLRLIADGGVGAIHVTFGKSNQSRRALAQIRGIAVAIFDRFRPLFRQWFRPKMQMNCYDLNVIIGEIHRVGVRRMHVELTEHGGTPGAMLIFQKRPQDRYLI